MRSPDSLGIVRGCHSWTGRWLTVVLASWLALLAGVAWAQKKPAKEGDDLPEPEDVVLTSKDGITIVATYYPGTHGKETVPILLLHMHKGSRVDYQDLALALQADGHAVLVPDLRGHGESPLYDAKKVKVEPQKLRRDDLAAGLNDVETCKKFLMDKNNSGELNIDKLCVVGAEYGAILALDWAASDWAWPPLAAVKQGQDVKALLLLSPKYSVEGFTLNEGLKSQVIQRELLIGILAGTSDTDARRLDKAFKGFRPQASAEKKKNPTYFFKQLNAKLEGTKLLEGADLGVIEMVRRFIDQVAEKKIPWQDRKVL